LVEAGSTIATIGMTGTTPSPLHHEVCIGSRCSLQRALENKESTCNTFNYDPQIHPLLIYPQASVGDSDVKVEYRVDLSDNDSKVVRVSPPDSNPKVNVYRIFIVVAACTNEIRNSHELDLNLRIGFDATTTIMLDTVETNFPYVP